MSAAEKKLPLFVREMMTAMPRAGGGVHRWLFAVAKVLHPYRSESDIEAILSASVATCGRTVPKREILAAIHNSRAAKLGRIQ
jgi:hypothetical protein